MTPLPPTHGDPAGAVIVPGTVEARREGFDDATRGNASWFTLFSGDVTPTGMCAGVMELRPLDGCLMPHRHAHAEIYYIAEGEGTLSVDGIETRLHPGAAAFSPGDAVHALRNAGRQVLKVFYVFPADRFSEIVYVFDDPNRV